MGQSSPSRARRGYASGLDGIRALAVIAVILYHAGVPGLRGGFVGVDLFFVVSGYLVTALLQRELDRTGRIRFGAFFRRRARRLLPALAVDADRGQRRDTRSRSRSQRRPAQPTPRSVHLLQQLDADRQGLVIRLPGRAGRADPLWSLAVEEQFYLLWPAVCIRCCHAKRSAAARRPRGGPGHCLGDRDGGDVPRRDRSDPAYEGTDTHGFGLLLGAALAFARRSSDIDPVKGRHAVPAHRTCGRGGPDRIAGRRRRCGIAERHGDGDLPGGLFVVNVAAMVLVAITVRGVGAVPTLLSLRLLRGIGPSFLRAVPVALAGAGHRRSGADPVDRTCQGGDHRPRRGVRRHRDVVALGRAPDPTTRRRRAIYARSGRRSSVGRHWSGTAEHWVGRGRLLRTGPRGRRVQRRRGTAGERVGRFARGRRGRPGRGQRGELAPPATPSPAQSTPEPSSSDPTETGQSNSVADPDRGRDHAGGDGTRDCRTRSAAMPTPPPTASRFDIRAVVRRRARPQRCTPDRQPPRRCRSRRPVHITGTQISAIGDSVMLASAPALLARFAGADIDAVVSRQIWDLGALIGPKVSRRTDAPVPRRRARHQRH